MFFSTRKSSRSRRKTIRERKRSARRLNLVHEPLEPKQLLTAVSFQEGVSGYSGAQDAIIYSINPDVNFGTETGMSPDQQDANGVRQGLVRYDNIFGEDPGQIPLGSTINSATWTVTVFNDSNSAMQMSLYRMMSDWNETTVTWNSFGDIGGVQASEGEVAGLPPDAVLFDASQGTRSFDVTTSLRHWAAGEDNLGWLVESAATNGWDFNTSEAASSLRPVLSVDFTEPSGSGSFQFLDLEPRFTEGDSGSSNANLTIARSGGVAGAASIDYTVTAGTATAGTDFVEVSTPVTVNFADGETVKTIPVEINGDADLEGAETVVVTLTGGSVISGRGVATLEISDDDALINEVLANISNSEVDETNREYVELIGTPGANLDDYYFVVFEGEEEEDGGSGSGIADLVVDLNGQTFGSNGLLVLTGTNWAYTKDAGTNQMTIAAFDEEGGLLEDSSQTYALVRSPTAAMVQGTDYDTVGFYEESPIAPQLSIGTGVGILDQMPSGSEIVDSVGVVEGGGNDRDRVATTVGHPGVHVHQPTRINAQSGGVASDAVSRREGVKDPNSIGVWFNGDIADGTATPINYENGTFFISVVAPDGSVLTPGAPNTLRNVFVSVTDTTVDESAGTVTVSVERSVTDVAISVDYTTNDGTALAGSDYTADVGTLDFGIGVATQDIVIDILSDSDAEGFENFSVSLTSASSPYLITEPTTTITIVDGDVQVATFEDEVNGYAGTTDTYLDSALPNLEFGFASSAIVDEEKGEGEPGDPSGSDVRPIQSLLRFEDVFGNGSDQVPEGAQVFGAFLTLNVLSPAQDADVRLFEMLQDWDESTATWSDPQGTAGSSIANGITPDDVEAKAVPDAVVTNPGGSGTVDIPLNRETIQAWANGSRPNFGWSIISDSADSWTYATSDDFLSIMPQRPKLTILYTDPSGAGAINYGSEEIDVNEDGTASVVVHRVGGSTGSISANWSLSAGTGSLGDVSGATSGTVTFNDGELTKTISIPINDDSTLEANETLNLSLTGSEVGSKNTATLTIRDNDFVPASPDVLLSEIFINSPGNDGTHEFIEVTGTADAGMGSLYVAIIGGDLGEGEGSTDLVVDLGSFLNGANGHSLITAENGFAFRVPDEATHIPRPELDAEIVSNDTASYLLLYSPESNLLTGRYDYDWDNDGTLELPAGVVIVDSIANKDNGITDKTYGPGANVIDSLSNPNDYTADAVTRLPSSSTRNSAAAWFHGDLLASGDDGLRYDPTNSVGIPVTGAAMTPGEMNTAAENVLVSLTNVTVNEPVGSVTATFSGPVSQLLVGDGGTGSTGAGITLTNQDGSPNGQVNMTPNVTGLGTNVLTISFTGSGVNAGLLPDGDYRLNFIGNSLISNGRVTDANNTSSDDGSDRQFDFSVTNTIPGDLNDDGAVDAADAGLMFGNWANSGIGDLNGDNIVDAADAGIMFANWTGDSAPAPVAATAESTDSVFEDDDEDWFRSIFEGPSNG